MGLSGYLSAPSESGMMEIAISKTRVAKGDSAFLQHRPHAYRTARTTAAWALLLGTTDVGGIQ